MTDQKLQRVTVRLPRDMVARVDALTTDGPIPELANSRAEVIRVLVAKGLAATQRNQRRGRPKPKRAAPTRTAPQKKKAAPRKARR